MFLCVGIYTSIQCGKSNVCDGILHNTTPIKHGVYYRKKAPHSVEKLAFPLFSLSLSTQHTLSIHNSKPEIKNVIWRDNTKTIMNESLKSTKQNRRTDRIQIGCGNSFFFPFAQKIQFVFECVEQIVSIVLVVVEYLSTKSKIDSVNPVFYSAQFQQSQFINYRRSSKEFI